MLAYMEDGFGLPGVNLIKLWEKANGEKCKVACKFFRAFFDVQQK
jgi:hypothetical protein